MWRNNCIEVTIDRERRRETTAILGIYKWTPLSTFDQQFFAEKCQRLQNCPRSKHGRIIFLELLVFKCAGLATMPPSIWKKIEEK